MGLIASAEPTRIIKGTTSRWTRSLADFPADEGWALSYRFVGPGVLTLACSATQTSQHFADLAATYTAQLPAGQYHWQSYAASGDLRYQVAVGDLAIDDDLLARSTSGAPYDPRSRARRIVDAIDAILSGGATLYEQSISVDGRSLANRGLDELLRCRDTYARIAAAEDKATRIANGGNPENSIRVRFVQQ